MLKKWNIFLIFILLTSLIITSSVAADVSSNELDVSSLFNNPDYYFKQLWTNTENVRWPDYNASTNKMVWRDGNMDGYIADFDSTTVSLKNITQFGGSGCVYEAAFSPSGEYVFYQDVSSTTSLAVTGGTIDAYRCYRYVIATGISELIFDISTIPVDTIEALTSYKGYELGFYIGQGGSDTEVIMSLRTSGTGDGGALDIMSYDIINKEFSNITNSGTQSEFDGRYFGTDTSKLLYWTENSAPNTRKIAILSGATEDVVNSTTTALDPKMNLTSRWGKDQSHVIATRGSGWSASDIFMFSKDSGTWSVTPEDLTGDAWDTADGGIYAGPAVGDGFIFGVRDNSVGANGLWIALPYPDEVWVDNDFTEASCGGHAWGYNAFSTIQEGIDGVNEGGTVNVAAGTYSEKISIVKELSLIGDDKDTTIIDGTATGDLPAVYLQTSDIIVKNFTIRNAGTSNNNQVGIALVTSDGCIIDNNIVYNNKYGIVLETYDSNSCDSNIISHNIIYSNAMEGIYVAEDSVNNTINCNTIYGHTNAGTSGIYLWTANDTTIEHNTIYGNDYGIHLARCSSNIIDSNEIYDNEKGLFIRLSENVAVGTTMIYYNNIYDNIAGLEIGTVGAIEMPSDFVTNAQNNWWGATDGPSGVGTGSGDSITAFAEYDPWLGAPVEDTKCCCIQNGTVDARDEANTTVTVKGTGDTGISIAKLCSNPGRGFTGDIGKYIDVYVPDPSNATEIEIRVYYTNAEVAGMNEGSLQLSWWNGSQWITCSNTGVNTAENYIWAVITATSIPSLDELDGTAFGENGMPNINLFALYMPMAQTNMKNANSLYACIMDSIPENYSQHVQEMLEQVQLHIEKAHSISNPIYSVGALFNVIRIMNELNLELGIECK